MLLIPATLCAAVRTVLLADENSSMVQNARADADNLSRMDNSAMVRRFARNAYLVPVPASTRSYYLHAVAPRYRYCRPWTRLFLERLSRQYRAQFGDKLRITSLVRTVQSQVALARINGNAADAFGPLRSSHLTGATLDISKHGMSGVEQQWLRDLLYSLREAGYLYAIEEFEQPTFHVMVYRSYPEYVARITGKSHPKRGRGRVQRASSPEDKKKTSAEQQQE